jgi:perosamine synthetase
MNTNPLQMSEANILETLVTEIRAYISDSVNGQERINMHLSGTGAVLQLEQKFARFYGKKYALSVMNATSALDAIAEAIGLRNKKILVPALTYGASLAAFLRGHSKITFADIDPHDLTLSPTSLASRLRESNVNAVLSVDILGVPADQNWLRQICDDHGVVFLADAAQSFGAFREGLPASVLADVLVVSMTVGKTVYAGEGAMILTDHINLYERLVWLTQHPFRQKRELGLGLENEFALNFRIHPLAAIWANTWFEFCLKRIQEYQQQCMEMISLINQMGICEPITFKERKILPAFFRLSAAWLDKPEERVLKDVLAKHGLRVEISELPCRIVYRHPTFLAQFKERLSERIHCPAAETQSRKRFCISFKRMNEGMHSAMESNVNATR